MWTHSKYGTYFEGQYRFDEDKDREFVLKGIDKKGKKIKREYASWQKAKADGWKKVS